MGWKVLGNAGGDLHFREFTGIVTRVRMGHDRSVKGEARVCTPAESLALSGHSGGGATTEEKDAQNCL